MVRLPLASDSYFLMYGQKCHANRSWIIIFGYCFPSTGISYNGCPVPPPHQSLHPIHQRHVTVPTSIPQQQVFALAEPKRKPSLFWHTFNKLTPFKKWEAIWKRGTIYQQSFCWPSWKTWILPWIEDMGWFLIFHHNLHWATWRRHGLLKEVVNDLKWMWSWINKQTDGSVTTWPQ